LLDTRCPRAQEIDFAGCISNPYNYVIDTTTGRPFPAADGRSPYQDPIDSEQYSKFYAFAWAMFTSCWASNYCNYVAHWGTWGKLTSFEHVPHVRVDHHSCYLSALCRPVAVDRHKRRQRPFYVVRPQFETHGGILRTC
jgi:hypothetical protein